jgi:hypothetical protein
MHVAPHELLTIVPRLAKVSVWLHSPFLSMPYIRTHKPVASIYNGAGQKGSPLLLHGSLVQPLPGVAGDTDADTTMQSHLGGLACTGFRSECSTSSRLRLTSLEVS